jgi:hypothetical protein
LTVIKTLFWMSLAFLVLHTPGLAGPPSSVKYLMNEPVSLFDFGIYEMERYFSGLESEETHVSSLVYYDYNSNRIIIQIWQADSKRFKTKTEAKDWSRSIICKIKNLLAIDCNTAKSWLPAGNSLVHQFFRHEGHAKSIELKNLGGEIDEIVEIRVGNHWGGQDKESKLLSCKVLLLDTDIFCSD